MVERLFDEQAPRSVSDDEPASKKTKGNQAQAIKHFGGTSAPKGTGYSGGGKEDVSEVLNVAYRRQLDKKQPWKLKRSMTASSSRFCVPSDHISLASTAHMVR